MSDLIKREDAIEAIDKMICDNKWVCECAINSLPSADAVCREALNDVKFVAIKGDKVEEAYRNGWNGAIECIIENAPSADAEQEWIPVSERLPKESGDYLCTIPLDADETYVDVLIFHNGRFYEDDDEWGATYYDDVTAWMPLPTPYKGGDTE